MFNNHQVCCIIIAFSSLRCGLTDLRTYLCVCVCVCVWIKIYIGVTELN